MSRQKIVSQKQFSDYSPLDIKINVIYNNVFLTALVYSHFHANAYVRDNDPGSNPATYKATHVVVWQGYHPRQHHMNSTLISLSCFSPTVKSTCQRVKYSFLIVTASNQSVPIHVPLEPTVLLRRDRPTYTRTQRCTLARGWRTTSLRKSK